MSDLENRPQGGGVERAVADNLSPLNPTDAAIIGQSGAIRPDMSIREYYARQGVDVDGPLTQMFELVKNQQKEADPLNKMKAIAGAGAQPQQGAPPPEQGPPRPETGGGGNPLDELLAMSGRG